MNILFCTFYDVSSTKGGTERITTTLAEGLKKEGYKCFLLYFKDIESSATKTDFEKRIHITKTNTKNRNNIKKFLIENNINTIIIQGLFETTSWLKEIVSELKGKKISIIFAHHFSPGSETNLLTLKGSIKTLKQERNLKNLAKVALYPIAKLKYLFKLHYEYKEAYLNADKVVLLSKSFIPSYIKYARLTSTNKFHIIHNALSFHSFFEMEQYDSKEKEVLIVSRLEEQPKRIGLALRIWEEIEKKPILKDWKLVIVGTGNDELKYKKFVKDHNLKRILFVGKQEPQSYYRKASIFIMTSSFEGWGLTLTEAQQYGVVPIAYDSYTSLHDIITNTINGFIIPNKNIAEYTEKLIYLMENHKKRKEMAHQCIASCKQFSQKEIVEEWIELLTSINK